MANPQLHGDAKGSIEHPQDEPSRTLWEGLLPEADTWAGSKGSQIINTLICCR